MRILGIDPGLATVGIGLIESKNAHNLEALDWMTICTPAGQNLADRLHEIEKDLNAYIAQMQPELAVVEKLYFSVNEKTALDVAQARGVVLATLSRHGIPLLEPTPPELKSCITGDGSANKVQMQQMVQTLFCLEHIPQPDDAADALALAAFGAFQGKKATVVV